MSQPRVIVATSNQGKFNEFQALLGELPIELVPLSRLPDLSLPAEGSDYEHNAVAKARAVADRWGNWTLADDSGLEVEGLEGAPGPLSARYGGVGLDDAARIQTLLEALSGHMEPQARRARFVCVVALVSPGGDVTVAHGECPGEIVAAVRGDGGFGYDPIFQPDGYDRTLGELPAELKDRISHRASALGLLRGSLLEVSGDISDD